MKLSNSLAILPDLWSAIQAALGPTLRAVLSSPSLIFHPAALSHLFMSYVWVLFGPGADENGRTTKSSLITTNAYGVVLDIGAGHGHTVNYLDRNKVSKYIALEPNTHMHPQIRDIANKAGFNERDETLLILACGAEDTASIISSLGNDSHTVDTFISVLSLCTIPSPEQSLTSLVRDVLKPGGQLLFYEHVLSPREDVAWWQRFWTPAWKLATDGCRLDRPTHLWVERMVILDDKAESRSIWSDGQVWGKDDEPEEHLFWHRVGRFVKA